MCGAQAFLRSIRPFISFTFRMLLSHAVLLDGDGDRCVYCTMYVCISLDIENNYIIKINY